MLTPVIMTVEQAFQFAFLRQARCPVALIGAGQDDFAHGRPSTAW